MENTRRVDVLHATQHLVQEILEVLIRQLLLRSNNAVQVAFHEICHDINVVEIHFIVWVSHDVVNTDDVVVSVEMAQQLNLP